MLAWTDFDHDGRQDFFYVTNSSSSFGVQLYRNLGTNTFQAVWTLPICGPVGVVISIACADMDNDGWEDLVVLGYHPSSYIQVWHNNRGEASVDRHEAVREEKADGQTGSGPGKVKVSVFILFLTNGRGCLYCERVHIIAATDAYASNRRNPGCHARAHS